MQFRFFLFLIGFLLHFAASASIDTTSVLAKIKEAGSIPVVIVAVPATPGAPDPVKVDRVSRLQKEIDASYELKATCDGRFNVLRFDLRRTVSRSEMISVGGGLLGVFGAIATCPHCAAIGAGLAGLANPLQQTFKDNEDTPDVYKAKLIALSDRINAEFDEYRRLPASDPENADFEKNLRARLDALMSITASCQYYEAQVISTKK